VTRILSQIEAGNRSAAQQLLPLVYDELRRLAAARLARERRPEAILQPTALVVGESTHDGSRGFVVIRYRLAAQRRLVPLPI
jgi:hypothetical protein